MFSHHAQIPGTPKSQRSQMKDKSGGSGHHHAVPPHSQQAHVSTNAASSTQLMSPKTSAKYHHGASPLTPSPGWDETSPSFVPKNATGLKPLSSSSRDDQKFFVFIISAMAGILLKSQDVYFSFSTILRTILNNSDICSAATVSVRIKFLKLPTTFQYSCDGTSEW